MALTSDLSRYKLVPLLLPLPPLPPTLPALGVCVEGRGFGWEWREVGVSRRGAGRRKRVSSPGIPTHPV